MASYMRINKLAKFTIIYLLIYLFLFLQFARNFEVFAAFINLDITSFRYQTLIVQIEFVGLQILKFYLINVYIDFYIQLKEMINIRRGNYKLILIKHILICVFIIMLPDIFIFDGDISIFRMLFKACIFIVLYVLQLSSNKKLIFAISPLVYSIALLLIN